MSKALGNVRIVKIGSYVRMISFNYHLFELSLRIKHLWSSYHGAPEIQNRNSFGILLDLFSLVE